jgi:carboxyvinyl-carboxyphosphonate phosphorylmutase
VKNNEPRDKLRAILAGRECIQMASIFDPISSRLAQELGFEAGLMGGSLVSHVVLGAPDLIVLTLTELAEQVTRCTRVSSVPIVVDGDHGYGNALSVMRTIEEMDRAGAAAVMIEDTLLPRPFGTTAAPSLLTMEEAVGKMKAAVQARRQGGTLVLGRTGAASIAGVDEAIARFQAFEAVGVDALFLPGAKSREELERISAAVSLPLILGGAGDSLRDPAYLASQRIRLWSGGHHAFAVAVQALHDAMRSIRDGVPSDQLPGIAGKSLMNCITGATDYDRWTTEFLAAKQP